MDPNIEMYNRFGENIHINIYLPKINLYIWIDNNNEPELTEDRVSGWWKKFI